MPKYDPTPAFLENECPLPEELLRLVEKLAENIHDTWAHRRLEEGWTFGSKQDSELKITPLLVPYDELDESEKEYDRQTAMATLRGILAHGYRIVPPGAGES